MHIFYCIFEFMQFPILDFGLDHFTSQPFNYRVGKVLRFELISPQFQMHTASCKLTLEWAGQASCIGLLYSCLKDTSADLAWFILGAHWAVREENQVYHALLMCIAYDSEVSNSSTYNMHGKFVWPCNSPSDFWTCKAEFDIWSSMGCDSVYLQSLL